MRATRFCEVAGPLLLGLLHGMATAKAQQGVGSTGTGKAGRSATRTVATPSSDASSPFRITGRGHQFPLEDAGWKGRGVGVGDGSSTDKWTVCRQGCGTRSYSNN